MCALVCGLRANQVWGFLVLAARAGALEADGKLRSSEGSGPSSLSSRAGLGPRPTCFSLHSLPHSRPNLQVHPVTLAQHTCGSLLPVRCLWPPSSTSSISQLGFIRKGSLRGSSAFHSFFFFLIFTLMWTIFKVFIEFVIILFFFFFMFWFFWLQAMWDLSSPTRDRTCTPCIGRQRLNHWTAREVPQFSF